MTAPTATPLRSMLSESATGFMPSSVSAREQRAREKTDRTIKQFIEKFIGKGFFPLDSEPLIFCLLPQLTEWPSDVQLKVVNENGDTIATYLKGSDPSVIKHSVSVVQDRSGEYATSSDDGDEELLPLIISQLPAGSQLGVGGDFPNSSSPDGRIVTLRKQLVDLLKSERAAVFEALLWDDGAMKCDPYFSHRNRFLPLWLQQVHEHSPVLKVLLALSPSVPAERLNALLDRFPLSEAEEQDFLDKDVLPASFIKALNHSVEEWRNDRALDGIFHKRTYNEDADALTRTCAQRILKSLLGYQLLIAEVDQEGKYVIDPEPSTASIVLLHSGNGYYAAKNLGNDEVYRFSGGTDTFYLAIASVLQPHERLSLGMHSDTDVDGLRLMLGNVAAAASGGWYDPQQPLQVKEASLPDWMKQASTADKLIWNNATQNYRQALIEAQAPALPSLSEYGDADQLRVYAKNLLRDRLEFDLGLRLDPDDITVEITNSEWIPFQGPVGLGPGGAVLPVVGGGLKITPTRCSLPQLCLQNISLFDLNFLLTASFVDKNDIPIKELSSRYVHSLVRELNVGDSYTAFLKQRLLTSFHGQWSRDQYARVMDAQMRLDAIEAKMAMDFLGKL
ncbi:hypothetical protein QN386_19685 [Pseudomonas sp. CCI3.2]|uniref:dermonecrotic toxin domain-containing protein n=1 Tax=unclassified Pseudomonas TaxID=196821 RepID=UPI002AC94E27|nr:MULTISPECIES: DUF6543 domain-containing protein [unclassified Pseudomonas]MEB0076967.1 hypothetical protein [Pseudomonas sp. MH10out]MEB0103530.1 hypothetical protein [Pseudomonas sp. CCI3.2]MEB0129593.1 hypothetical protein [Pseudomonas sp. CCI2.4]MEB0159890.1 hypothetical protein [Pseudomonas sp. AH2 (2023)]MEB0165918.1 hypothetical protein [Pseudomonas sp. CCC4.4]